VNINPLDLESTATAYEQAAEKLREAASILRNGPVQPIAANTDRVVANGTPTGTRLDQLTEWLRARGPSTRKEIKAGCGLPDCTISALLTRNHFDKDDEGRWKVREESEEEE
jgi:hypothetical protein